MTSTRCLATPSAVIRRNQHARVERIVPDADRIADYLLAQLAAHEAAALLVGQCVNARPAQHADQAGRGVRREYGLILSRLEVHRVPALPGEFGGLPSDFGGIYVPNAARHARRIPEPAFLTCHHGREAGAPCL